MCRNMFSPPETNFKSLHHLDESFHNKSLEKFIAKPEIFSTSRFLKKKNISGRVRIYF